jgi:hypothetical protein
MDRERVKGVADAGAAKQDTGDTAGADVERSLQSLKEASSRLKARIEEEKRRLDMPLDSALGNPEEEQRNSDGRLDLPNDDEE